MGPTIEVNTYLVVYYIGCVIAFFLGCYDAITRQKKGENISEFPAAIPCLTFMSWFYILMYIYNTYFRKDANK